MRVSTNIARVKITMKIQPEKLFSEEQFPYVCSSYPSTAAANINGSIPSLVEKTRNTFSKRVYIYMRSKGVAEIAHLQNLGACVSCSVTCVMEKILREK